MAEKKITTETCVSMIEGVFAFSHPGILERHGRIEWTRLSKHGKAGEPVVRVFAAKSLPMLQATIEEVGGALKMPAFSVLGEHDVHERLRDRLDGRLYQDPDIARLAKESGVVPPEAEAPEAGYVFAIMDASDEMGEGAVWVAVTPTNYWRENGHAYDDHLEDEIGDRMPKSSDGTPAEEMTEGTFLVTGKSEAQVEREMIAAGFANAPDFKAFMTRGAAGHGM